MSRTDDQDRGGGSSEPQRGGKLQAELDGIISHAEVFARKLLALSLLLADVLEDGYELGREILNFFKKYGSRSVSLGVLAGSTSPLTGGWGWGWLAASHLRLWAPVLLAPLAVTLFEGMLAAFTALDREGARAYRRYERSCEPVVETQLDALEIRRDTANKVSLAQGQTQTLDDCPYVGENLLEAIRRMKARGVEVHLTLRRATRKYQLREVDGTGPLDDAVEAQIAFSWKQLSDIDRYLREALEPFELEHYVVVFSVGTHNYVLMAISGNEIPGHARLEISEAATRIAEIYAFGTIPPAAMAGR